MSKFGSTGQFNYDAALDAIAGGTSIALDEWDMPQYPMEETRVTDDTVLTTLSGKTYIYGNYNKRQFVFNWTDLSQSKRDDLATMADSKPILSFTSGALDWGTFRMIPGSFTDSETSFELFDLSFEVVEDK